MIETPRSYFDMPAIAAAAERTVAMSIGGEDFASEVGMEPTEETLQLPKQTMIYAAKSAGLMPFGYIASVAGFGDWEGFRRMVRRSRQFGFMGASCIHPGQVPIVTEEYTPSAEEVAYAQRLIEADRDAAAAGRGSFAIDGKMIDIPVIRRAETPATPRPARAAKREVAARTSRTGPRPGQTASCAWCRQVDVVGFAAPGGRRRAPGGEGALL